MRKGATARLSIEEKENDRENSLSMCSILVASIPNPRFIAIPDFFAKFRQNRNLYFLNCSPFPHKIENMLAPRFRYILFISTGAA